jgi:hypothetical protein
MLTVSGVCVCCLFVVVPHTDRTSAFIIFIIFIPFPFGFRTVAFAFFVAAFPSLFFRPTQGSPSSVAKSLVDKYAGVSQSMGKDDIRIVCKIAEVAKTFLDTLARCFVRDRQYQAIAVVFGSDTTPLRTRQRWLSKVDELLVVRSSVRTDDWLIQRCFLYDGFGNRATVLPDPVLLADKTAWSHFEAQRRLFPLPRQLGHRGIALHHHVWDGAVKSACERAARQLHSAHHLHTASIETDGETILLQLRSWVTCVRCILHVCHNGLRWAISEWINDKDLTRSCWIVSESLVNSQHVLLEHLDSWVEAHIEYSDSLENLAELWALLGFCGDWLDLLVGLQLRWHQGRLHVGEHLRHDPRRPQLLRTAFVRVFRFRSFSSSRWCGVAETARCLVSGSLIGLDSLANCILAEPSARKFFLQGFAHFAAKVRHMLAVTVCSSSVAEGVLNILQEDDRVVRNLQTLEDELNDSLLYVMNLPDFVIQVVAEFSGISGHQLRQEATQAASVQVAHIGAALREARGHPWSLAVGDVAANLRSLSSGVRPREETAAKIFDMLQIGITIEELVDGVSLMLDVPWSSSPAEQGHAAASRLLRRCKQLGSRGTQARSLIIHLAPLLSKVPEDVNIARLQEQADRLHRIQPDRITGRHILFGDMQRLTKVQRDAGRGIAKDFGKQITAKHCVTWNKLPDWQKATFNFRARELQHDRRDEIYESIVELEGKMDVLRVRAVDEAAASQPCRMTSCRLTSLERSRFRDLFLDGRWTDSVVETL